MTGFTIRNLKVFFKDKASVFFSLLAVFIIIGLYALFLGDVWVSGYSELGGVQLSGVRFMMDSWIVAGLLAVTSVTTTMGAFGTMVDDRTRKIDKDFAASPISRIKLVGGYVASSVIIGIIMTLVTLLLSEIYIVANGGELMNLVTLIKVVGLIVLSTVTNTSMVFFMVSFFRSSNAFSTACTVLGTLIGFLTGIYLPIGELPNAVQWVVKCFPVSHAAALMRQTIMADPIAATFKGVPAEYVQEFKQSVGVEFEYNGTVAAPIISILVLAGTAVVFYALSVLNISRKRR